MRRSNWKTKVIVVIASILSIVLGVVAAMFARCMERFSRVWNLCGYAACISIYFSKSFTYWERVRI